MAENLRGLGFIIIVVLSFLGAVSVGLYLQPFLHASSDCTLVATMVVLSVSWFGAWRWIDSQHWPP